MEEEQHKSPELTKEASPKSETETQVDKDKKLKKKTAIKKKTFPEKHTEVIFQLGKRSLCTISMHEIQYINQLGHTLYQIYFKYINIKHFTAETKNRTFSI